MIVVADAGPLIHLAAVGHLDLIRQLSLEVFVPSAVYHEVVVVGAGMAGAREVSEASWLTVVEPVRAEIVQTLLASGLQRGEAEAIAIAVDRHADMLLIDERQGRLTAEAMGLTVVGSIGIVVAGKIRGDIPRVAPVLTAMRESGLWVSDALLTQVLASVGEPAAGEA